MLKIKIPKFAMEKRLFGNNIEPGCRYCRNGRPAPDGIMVLCRKYGPISPSYCCKRYAYDPLKRAPKRQPKLPEFSQEDFSL